MNLWVSDNATALSTYGLINTWNVSLITDMTSLFYGKTTFNDDISTWDVSNVTTMKEMFRSASSFNQDISNWDVSNVTTMTSMFWVTSSFNQNLSGWNVSNVTDMSSIFRDTDNFNGDISSWDLGSALNMYGMFYNAQNFNGDIANWNVSSVTEMRHMFDGAAGFNQNLSSWDVANVANMADMFTSANALSDTNKGLIHSSFSTNSNWAYDWSAHVVTLETGLVAYYPFDGNASDMSGNGRHGTVNGGASLGLDRQGVAGKAYVFDGVNDYVETSYSSGLNSPSFSYSLWVSSTVLDANIGSPITSRKAGSLPNPYRGYMLYKTAENTWEAWLGFTSGWAEVTGPNVVANQWTHLAVSLDVGSYALFVDGSLAASSTVNDFIANPSQPLRIGAGTTEATPQFFFNGSIDEVRIYNRALSAAEVAALYTLENTPPNRSPVFSESNATFTTAENNSSASFIIGATDPDGDVLTYAKSGADADKFTLNVNTGELTFNQTPDYEANASAVGNNTYAVTVTVTDGEANGTQIVTVNVTDDPVDNPFNPSTGLVAWYPFDGNASDMSVNNNHGTVNGGASLGLDRQGVAGKAYVFDGVDDDVEFAQTFDYFQGSVTFTAWVRIPANADRGILFGDFGGSNASNINFEVAASGPARLFWNGSPDLNGQQNLHDDQWRHLAFIRDKTQNKSFIYVDGQLDVQTASAGSDRTTGTPHVIGRDKRIPANDGDTLRRLPRRGPHLRPGLVRKRGDATLPFGEAGFSHNRRQLHHRGEPVVFQRGQRDRNLRAHQQLGRLRRHQYGTKHSRTRLPSTKT